MKHKSGTFWDYVRILREQGQIARAWKSAELTQHLDGLFRANTITSLPYNSSIEMNGHKMGDYVKKGAAPKAWRVGRGLFELVADPDDDLRTQASQVNLARARAELLRERKPALSRAEIFEMMEGSKAPRNLDLASIFPDRRSVQSKSTAASATADLSASISIALTETERAAMVDLSVEQKAMAVVRSYLIDKYGHSAKSEDDRKSTVFSVSIDGVTVMLEAKRVTPKDERYPLRGLPYRYDRPHDPVALEDWNILK